MDADLEGQRTAWSIWLTPRPARVKYGIALTRALLRHMQDFSRLRGARFGILLTPGQGGSHTDVPMALVHDGHWFLADPATRDAAISRNHGGVRSDYAADRRQCRGRAGCRAANDGSAGGGAEPARVVERGAGGSSTALTEVGGLLVPADQSPIT